MQIPFRRTLKLVALGLVAAGIIGTAFAQALHDAEVANVDKDKGKITLKHDKIPSLGLPAIKMAYHVRDASVLDRFQPGDKVRFTAEKLGGQYTVTAIEPVK